MIDANEVRRFWFGDEVADAAVAKSQMPLWWDKNPAIDAQMRERFQALVEAVGAGAHRDWAENPEGLLALILVADQFPRNIHRDTPKSFAFDAQALQLTRMAVAKGFDRRLRPIERVFCYMPFEHSEDSADQERAVELFQALVDEAPASDKKIFEHNLEFAKKHRAVILRFGRFPHRNRILGRESTTDEIEFLRQPGSSF